MNNESPIIYKTGDIFLTWLNCDLLTLECENIIVKKFRINE